MSDKTASILTILAAVAIVLLVGYSYLRETGGLPVLGAGARAADSGTPAGTTATSAAGDAPAPAMPACVCHSTNPAMVTMHDALSGEDCAACHAAGEDLMSPNRDTSSKDALKKRRSDEAICRECHRDGKTVVARRDKGKTKISNALFCPRCKEQLQPDDAGCGDCGGSLVDKGDGWSCTACGPLVDVNKVAALSKEQPSNDICALCHYDTRSLTIAHTAISAYNKSIATVRGGLSNCLACHTSHNQCGGCHF